MILKGPLHKLVLTAHVTSSIGWIGAVIAYLVLVIATLTDGNIEAVRATWVALKLIGWFAIVPLALAALLTGIVISLGTKWGLFRHYWVIFKLVLTTIATIILLLHMPAVSYFAGIATDSKSTVLDGLGSELLHSGVGLVVLLVTTTLAIFKPRGMTSYGQRRQSKQTQSNRNS